MTYHCVSNARLYQGTIRFNILLGANRDASQEEIDQAAKNANVLTYLSQ
jgi:ABC-type multidrug transport system fused ATPase/permease subunit